MRIEIHDLKSRMKSLYNYLSNLTPFFFFAVGGYLVLQDRLSLGALVAALAAFREIAPALRELFDFAQAWSDARARFAEVTRVIKANPDRASTGVTEAGGLERLRSVG
jgi:ABC-type bacteriocin/lantibiotic exporter with double-glycine peptidase domain